MFYLFLHSSKGRVPEKSKIENRGSRERSETARGEMFGSLVHQGQAVRSD